jgi:hypothetical protein
MTNKNFNYPEKLLMTRSFSTQEVQSKKPRTLSRINLHSNLESKIQNPFLKGLSRRNSWSFTWWIPSRIPSKAYSYSACNWSLFLSPPHQTLKIFSHGIESIDPIIDILFIYAGCLSGRAIFTDKEMYINSASRPRPSHQLTNGLTCQKIVSSIQHKFYIVQYLQ